jgi:hypothetical protein
LVPPRGRRDLVAATTAPKDVRCPYRDLTPRVVLSSLHEQLQRIRLEMGAAFHPSDDAVYAFRSTRFAQVPLVSDSDVVKIADVGWKVFVDRT